MFRNHCFQYVFYPEAPFQFRKCSEKHVSWYDLNAFAVILDYIPMQELKC